MEGEPLKNKIIIKQQGHDWMTTEDFNLAIKLLRIKLNKDIDDAFEDIVKKYQK